MINTTKTSILTTAAAIGMINVAHAEPNPYTKPDRSWISLSGEVENVRPDVFTLDYGKGEVTVEMDDFDNDADAYKLVEGDKVTVYGRIDDDMFETTSIEASSVWVNGLNTYFYASSADEEDIPPEVFLTPSDDELSVSGKIHSIEGSEFTIDTGTRRMRVETANLGYDPLDDEGYQKLDIGDRVHVSGEIDRDTWERREIMSDSIITLKDASKADEQ